MAPSLTPTPSLTTLSIHAGANRPRLAWLNTQVAVLMGTWSMIIFAAVLMWQREQVRVCVCVCVCVCVRASIIVFYMPCSLCSCMRARVVTHLTHTHAHMRAHIHARTHRTRAPAPQIGRWFSTDGEVIALTSFAVPTLAISLVGES